MQHFAVRSGLMGTGLALASTLVLLVSGVARAEAPTPVSPAVATNGPASAASASARISKKSCSRKVKRCSTSVRYRKRINKQSNRTPQLRRGQFGAGPYPNARIADLALSMVGRISPYGECKPSVNAWVRIASNGAQRLGGSYYADYRREGGFEVSRDEVVKGDIIQLNNPRDLSSNIWYRYMHSAVVVGHTRGSNTFDVVDANFGNPYNAVKRHAWNPYTHAAMTDLVVKFWRMGTATAQPAPPPPAAPARVAITAPAPAATVSGTVRLAADAANVNAVRFEAYYATDPQDVRSVAWRPVGTDTNGADGWSFDWDTRAVPDQGNPDWGTINVVAIGVVGGALTATRDYRRISVKNAGLPGPPGPAPSPVPVTHYDCPAVPNAFGHYLPAGTHWGNDFTAQGRTITSGWLTLGSNTPQGARIGIYTGGPSPLSGELGAVEVTVSGYGGVSFTFGTPVSVTPGQRLWLAATSRGPMTAYDRNDGGADGCFQGGLAGFK